MVDYSRVLVYSQQDEPLFEIAPKDIYSMVLSEELGGEHTLAIETSKTLEMSLRILMCDATGKWREFVVYGMNEDHYTRTYLAVWSLQADMSGITCDTMPGTRVSGGVSAHDALESLLTNTNRWGVGTVTCGTYSKASFYGMSGWEALGVLSENWGCEIDSEITVGTHGVLSRNIALLEHVGSQSAVRRFDWSYDLIDIHRKVSEKPLYARIIPLGKGEEITDGSGDVTGYGRRLTIESVNGGIKWLQNDSVADSYKLPDGNGGWEYPTRNVIYDGITDALELKNTALEDINLYTLPYVTYSASVAQFAAAGLDAKGVSLGDEIQCVDSGFGTDGIRLNGRVVRIVTNLLDASDVQLTIGNVTNAMPDYFQKIQKTFSSTQSRIHGIDSSISILDEIVDTTVEYIANIIDNINSEINATGGYTYITDGKGLVTYDTAVSDPKIGAEASKVVEIKGGSIRIANSRTAQGEWEWKTVFVSGHIAADLVTAAQIITGYIGSYGGTYINLDTNVVHLGNDNEVHTIIDDSGMEIFNDDTSIAYFGEQDGTAIARVGQNGKGNVVMSGTGYVDIRNGSLVLTHFGYGEGTNSQGGTSVAPYYTIGQRITSTVGNYSTSIGYQNTASGYIACAEGYSSTASGNYSHAEGSHCTASKGYSHAGGLYSVSNGVCSFAHGNYVEAQSDYQTVVGKYNVKDSAGKYLFIVGNGINEANRSNAFTVDTNGDISCYCYTTSTLSDFFTASNTATTVTGHLERMGKVVTMYVNFAFGSSVSKSVNERGVISGGSISIGTIKSGFRPDKNISFIGTGGNYATPSFSVGSDGSLAVSKFVGTGSTWTANNTTGGTMQFCATYVIP